MGGEQSTDRFQDRNGKEGQDLVMEEVSKPYGIVTDDCVELVGRDAVSVAGVRGLQFKPDVLPTVNPERGLTVTFWLKVEQLADGWNVLFHCGSDPHRTPAAWFHDQSTHVTARLSTTTDWNDGSGSEGNVFEVNTWQHGAYIQQGNDLAFYVDGLKVVAYLVQGKPVYPDRTHPFFLGCDGKHTSCCGQFKHVRFYNYALDFQKVKRDMHSVEPICELSMLQNSILTSYENLVDNPLHSDVKFRVCGATVHAHRCILCARSQYFQGMFGGSMKEASSAEIAIDGVSLDAFLALLRYLYAGKVPTDPEKALELMVAADYFSVERSLSDQIHSALTVKVTLENACQLLRTADRFGQESVKQMIMRFMSKNNHFVQLVGGEELYALPRPLLREFLTFSKSQQ